MSPVVVWWKCYPARENGATPRAPNQHEHPDPRLPIGAQVRLSGKPAMIRKVLSVDWHWIRKEYAYIVETSAKRPTIPYWFAQQLIIEVSDT